MKFLFRRFFLYTLLGLLAAQLCLGQSANYRYLILFKDKSGSNYSTNQPQVFLSARALARRNKMNVSITEQDLPVNSAYISQLKSQGAQVLYPIKWLNGAVVKIDASTLKNIVKLPFVSGYYKNMPLDSLPYQTLNTSNRTLKSDAQPDYGTSATQIAQLGVDVMHQAGYRGENILISLLDDGFGEANNLVALATVNQEKRILATLTTDPTRKSVYESGSHGTEVLSTLAAQEPGKLYGTAFMANFALAQTEESQHELLIEEVNWLRGAEWADSLGTDIISSSLGYTKFDNSAYDHSYQDMDGRKTLSSLAALWASRRGILCSISAGNEGASNWKYISSPADADSILSVAAVDRTGVRATFSSLGPSYDNRIKPDVAAMGLSTVVALPTGTIATRNGTSFSAPLLAGLAAGLLQANPTKNVWEIMQSIRASGSNATKPDNFLGYGIPHFDRAYKLINPILSSDPKVIDGISIYPNPLSTGQPIHIKNPSNSIIQLTIISAQGTVLQTLNNISSETEIYLPPFLSGKYYFRFTSDSGSQTIPVLLNL